MNHLLLSALLLLAAWNPLPTDPAGPRPVALRRVAPEVEAPDMVQVPGGCFQMGSPGREPKRQSHENQRYVCLETFAIGRYEVTFEEFDRFVAATGHSSLAPGKDWLHRLIDNAWGRARRPVINVTYHDAEAYAQWLSRQTGERYRLPTEAEWEYAARAGQQTPFQFGDTIIAEQANFNATEGYRDNDPVGEYRRQTLPVGQFSPNPWGLYDVHGNAREWTCSGYSAAFDGAERRCLDPGRRDGRVVRGGDWSSLPGWVRFASRLDSAPDNRNSETGFRLVRDTPPGRLPPQLVRTP